jgi:HEAT repeat protein
MICAPTAYARPWYNVKVIKPAKIGKVESAMASRSIDELVFALANGDRAQAQNAAEALGRLGGLEACAALGNGLLHHKETPVRVACANALGVMGGSDAAEILVGSLNEPDRVVWHAAAEALAGLDEEAMEAVLVLLQKSDPSFRRAAMNALLWLTVEYDEAEPSVSDDLILGGWGWWN